jgi:hypothetical protein
MTGRGPVKILSLYRKWKTSSNGVWESDGLGEGEQKLALLKKGAHISCLYNKQ